MKRKERGIVVASQLRSIINDQVEGMREAGISVIALPCRRTSDADIQSVFQKPKAIIIVLAFLKAGFNKKNPARVLLA